MKSWKLATIFAVALLLLAPSVNAQCPADATPLSVLVGSWAYQCQLVGPTAFPPLPTSYVSAGAFTASIGTDRRGNPAGVLTSIQSSLVNGNPVRFESDFGASFYEGFANCGGVTLEFSFSTRGVVLDCWFQANRNILYCVSATTEFPVICHASRTATLATVLE